MSVILTMFLIAVDNVCHALHMTQTALSVTQIWITDVMCVQVIMDQTQALYTIALFAIHVLTQ